MVSVALIRPVWWIACRSVRFVTALALMGLLLGGGAGRSGPAAESRPLVTSAGQSTVEAVDAEASAGAPTVGVGQPSVADGPPGSADQASGSADEPVADSTGEPAGDAYARVVGARAPPLG